MFSELIPLLLFGTSEVTAQLDFGSYKIVNRASQTSLCSHDLGEPIYVPAQGYSSARESWKLWPGDKDGLYTVKNNGLNFVVSANKTSGPTVENNMATSFAVSPAGDHDFTIRLPGDNLVWTVGPTIISHSDILLQPENGDDTQLWTFTPTDDMIDHTHFVSLQEAKHDLTVVGDIEKLRDVAWTHSDFALAMLWSALVYTRLDVVVAGKFKGHGTASGLGIAVMGSAGTLSYDSEDTLLSAENDFNIISVGAAGGFIIVDFLINDQSVAVLTLGGAGVSLIKASGKFTWTKD